MILLLSSELRHAASLSRLVMPQSAGWLEESPSEVCISIGDSNVRLNEATVIFFVTVLHGLTPRLGVLLMNVRTTSSTETDNI